MASRSHEAAGDGWEHDGAPTAHHAPATGGATERERRLRARVAELEAELDRSEGRIRRNIDEYGALLERERRARRAQPPAGVARLGVARLPRTYSDNTIPHPDMSTFPLEAVG